MRTSHSAIGRCTTRHDITGFLRLRLGLQTALKCVDLGAQESQGVDGETGLLAERVLCCGLVRHPCRNAGERAVSLQDDRQPDAAVLELSLDQHSLTAARMEP